MTLTLFKLRVRKWFMIWDTCHLFVQTELCVYHLRLKDRFWTELVQLGKTIPESFCTILEGVCALSSQPEKSATSSSEAYWPSTSPPAFALSGGASGIGITSTSSLELGKKTHLWWHEKTVSLSLSRVEPQRQISTTAVSDQRMVFSLQLWFVLDLEGNDKRCCLADSGMRLAWVCVCITCVSGAGPAWAVRAEDRLSPWGKMAVCTETQYSMRSSTLSVSTMNRSALTGMTTSLSLPKTFSQVSSPTETFISQSGFYLLYNDENNGGFS